MATQKTNKHLNDDINHNGHRERLTQQILNCGIDDVSAIQAVEFFLTYILPRGDVNPLAHRLLDRFGNFHNILEANTEDLKSVKGINERPAKKICAFKQLFHHYTASKLTKGISLKNTKDFLDYIEQLLRFEKTENLFIFAIDSAFRLIRMQKHDMNEVRKVGIKPLALYNFISSTKLSYLAVAHNHPNGTAISSPDDKGAYDFIQKLIENLDCRLIDSLVVGEDGIFSEFQCGFVRRFESVEFSFQQNQT